MRSGGGFRRQCTASAVALVVLGGLGLSCGREPPQPTALPGGARLAELGALGTRSVRMDVAESSGTEMAADDAADDDRAGGDTTVAPDDEATSTTDGGVTATTDDDANTTMAPSTSSAKRSSTPVALSTKRAPSGPGVPSIPHYEMSPEEREFFDCVVFRESSGNPGVINASSGAAGLFQFLQSTWDATARHVGRYDLVGVNPALAPVDLQWYFAHVLFVWQGSRPWLADGCQLRPARTTTTRSASPASPTTTGPWSVTVPPVPPPTSAAITTTSSTGR